MRDDSKALMKMIYCSIYLSLAVSNCLQVYLPTIAEYVPAEMLKALSAFLDFCYLARRTDFDEDTLHSIHKCIQRFHQHHEIFRTSGVCENFSLPRQHALLHYLQHIHNFGAPGGLCSSITESQHITAVKKLWCRSSCYEALSQMLLTNQRLDKLAAMQTHFIDHGMLIPSHDLPPKPHDLDATKEGAVDEDCILAEVKLAHTQGK
jgi:hypothetical protein